MRFVYLLPKSHPLLLKSEFPGESCLQGFQSGLELNIICPFFCLSEFLSCLLEIVSCNRMSAMESLLNISIAILLIEFLFTETPFQKVDEFQARIALL